MAENSHFMGQDGFVWFVGVVEDRNDPSALGRVRVRCLGYHTENITELPTTDLPWAHVMHPVTDPCMHGMGNTPSFLVEGSWVVGFFRDPEKQQLVIMGSLPGVPEDEADPAEGFNDPRGKNAIQEAYKGDPRYGPYPVDGEEYFMESGHEIGESDTNRLAQGKTSETHESLKARRNGVWPNIPIATQPYLKAVSDEAIDELAQQSNGQHPTWDEPDSKGHSKDAEPYTSGQYPYNHVFESESGHIREIDDSPGAQRLFTQHCKGTFEEIHPDSTKVVKVIGNNYEIIAGFSNVFIKGDVNLTYGGNVRQLVVGDYILEVGGNYTQKIHKNLRTRVGAGEAGGNLEEEINGNHAFHIKGYVRGNIGPLETAAAPGEGDVDINIVGNETHIIGKNLTLHAQTDTLISTGNDMMLTATTNMNAVTTSGIMSVKSGDKIDIRSKTSMLLNPETTLTETVGTNAVRTVGGTLTDTITGVAGIKYTADATFQYVNAFKEKIDGDHYIDKEGGKVDHTHPVAPSRTAGTDAVDDL
tara:strand:+ start:3929 stop:5515 length:1587 start_codon:yes stop_codon:yes gene_type:complete